MKRILTLFLALFALEQLNAQAPVTDISWLPSAGDKFYIYRITYTQTTNPFINPGDTGANVTWDFNEKAFNLNYPTDSILYKLPSAVPVTPVNSQTNLAYGDSTNYVCYIKNLQGLSLTQSRSTAVNNTEFPITKSVYYNPPLIFKNNLTFRSSFIDTSIDYHNYRYSGLDSPARGKSLSNHKYDAYGTLKISSLQFNNVIRTFEQRQQRDSFYNSNDKFYNQSNVYTWHSSSLGNALLTYIESYSVNLSSTNDTSRYASLTLKLPSTYITSMFTPVAPLEQVSASFYNNEIIIKAEKDFRNTDYIIYDIQGRTVKQGKISIFSNKQENIPLNTLPKGTYLLKLQGNNINKTFKLIKQ